MISCFRLKGPCSSVCGKKLICQHSQIIIIVKSVIHEKYFDKYKNKKMYAKIRVALGVCFSIPTSDYKKTAGMS